jgi:hypothetical protein
MIGQAEYTVHRGYVMSEHEKYEQVGRLAEEVGKLKGELNHVNEKLARASTAYNRLGQSTGGWTGWSVNNKTLLIPAPSYGGPMNDFSGLLNEHQLIEVLEHKQKLTVELNTATERLKGLAPHLF